MAKLYQADIWICATVYVKAKNKTEARKMAKKFAKDSYEFHGDLISDKDLSAHNSGLPNISLSPCMTGHGLASSIVKRDE